MSTMNDYEAGQVREIALWKSERPGLLMDSYRALMRPVSRWIARVVPKGLAKHALARVESLSEFHDSAADIVELAGVSAVSDLLGRPLEDCDRLAGRIGVRSEHLALLEGSVPAACGLAIPGIGGEAAAIADVPVLLEATVRAVRRIGHCYGFRLDTELDRRFVLAILEVASDDAPGGPEEDRLGLWSPDGPLIDPAASETIEGAVVDDLPIEGIPVAGDLANLVLDYAFVRRADATARRVFQERWLRANGKVDSIPPAAEVRRRSSIEGAAAVASEVAYTGAYGVAFGVTFPAALVGLAVDAIVPEPVRRGFIDGGSAASRDSRELVRKIGPSSAGPIPALT